VIASGVGDLPSVVELHGVPGSGPSSHDPAGDVLSGKIERLIDDSFSRPSPPGAGEGVVGNASFRTTHLETPQTGTDGRIADAKCSPKKILAASSFAVKLWKLILG
jgi:hypothetical protein